MDGRTPTRRQVLGAASAASTAALAGCSGVIKAIGGGQPSLVVFNRRDARVTAKITVESGDESLLSTEKTIKPDDGAKFKEVFSSSRSATITVAVDGGPEGNGEFEVSKDASIQAYIKSDSVDFEKM